MRTDTQMLELILEFAHKSENIRLVGMEGSRVNENIQPDLFQDYDITYFVKDTAPFLHSDSWLSFFGKIIMLQKPEDMELFPPEEEGYSYLIIFDDYIKLDLTLLELDKFKEYQSADHLRKILLDKDNLCPQNIIPNDTDYWIKKPSPRSFDDCCNEFWNLTSYVVKGLCRKEALFAIDHLYLMRKELLRMLSWQIGFKYGFNFSLGKNYKFIDKYMETDHWLKLMNTYNNNSYNNIWNALFACQELFREASSSCARNLDCEYPSYDQYISRYTQHFYQKYNNGFNAQT